MKKIYTSLFALLLLSFAAQAQCTVNPNAQTTPGVNPTAPNCPCITRNVAYTQTLQAQIQSSKDTSVSGFNVHIVVDSVRLDSISGLPNGITWTKTPDVLLGGGNGAVCFAGSTNDPAGNYPISGWGTVWLRGQISGFPDVPQTITGNLDQYSPFGGYYLDVIEQGGSCHGSVVALSVGLGSNQSVCSGTLVTLTPTPAGGQSPYTYAWTNTGSALSCNNCTSPTSTVTQNSTYTVTVTDGAASTATATVSYSIQPPVTPTIAISPVTVTGCSSTPVTFTSTITNGGSSPAYSWSVNTVSTGQTGTTFTASGLAYNDVVACVLTSNAGCVTQASATSNPVTLAFSNHFNQQPADANVTEGAPAHFSTSASNVNSSYQWQQNTGIGFVDLSNAGAYSGTDGNILTVSPVIAAYNNYLYRCIVSSPVGCSDTSDAALLSVIVTGIQEMAVSKISVYPNPSKGNIFFNLNDDKAKSIDIYEVKGGFVKQIIPIINRGQINVDISDLTSGMYFVVVKGDRTYRGKFVKE